MLQLINRQAPPVQRLDLFGFEATTIDWDAYLEDEAAPLRERPRKEVRLHQHQALDDVFAGLKEHDRGKLIMACGTGKTFTALRAAEEIAGAGGRVLFAAPSISLVAQALREWGQDAELPIRAFAICSDAKVAGDDAGARTYDLPIPPTTDPARLAAGAAKNASDRLTVVFSTYQSMAVIRAAQAQGMPAFDLVVCNEAHRTTSHTLTGEERSAFMLIHDRGGDPLSQAALHDRHARASTAMQARRRPRPTASTSPRWTTRRSTAQSCTVSASPRRWRTDCFPTTGCWCWRSTNGRSRANSSGTLATRAGRASAPQTAWKRRRVSA